MSVLAKLMLIDEIPAEDLGRSCDFTRESFVAIFVSFSVVYPLALDGTIPNITSGDWAVAMIPM